MFANRFTVVLDACVLVPPGTRDLILSLAEAKFFRPRWSTTILAETERNIDALIKRRKPDANDSAERAGKVIAQMQKAFPEACVDDGYKLIEPSLSLPDERDRHVLAAAIHCRASTIVTDNLKDFPSDILEHHEMEAKSADHFIADEVDLEILKAVGVVRTMRERLRNPEMSGPELLLRMETRGLVETVNLLRDYENLI